MDHHHGHSSPSGDMPMSDMPGMKCSMNMLWNNQVSDVCVVFESWHISGPLSMLFSCAVVAGLSYGYYWLQMWSKQYDRRLVSQMEGQMQSAGRDSPLLGSGIASGSNTPLEPAFRGTGTIPRSPRLIRSSVAAFQVFLSFFLMLVAMTYNSYLIAAVVLGAFLGKWRLEPDLRDVGVALQGSDDRGLSCH